ncbi:MAG TPA: hypothetical protein VFJ50_00530 [Gemmatimonadales bacterium]|nr:hypothetical protein [Gemmatimonadales bacterium]
MTMPRDSNALTGASPGAESREGLTSSAKEQVRDAKEQVREMKDQVVDQAKASFRQARDSATSSLKDSRQQAADRIGGIASAVRSTSDHLRSENQVGVANLTDSLADQVERLSGYLRDRDLGAFRDDVETFARRQPAVAVGIALALGVLGARFLKSSQRGQSRGESRRFRDEEVDWSSSPTYGMSSQPGVGGYGTAGGYGTGPGYGSGSGSGGGYAGA